MDIKTGTEFLHTKWLAKDYLSPMRCVITKIKHDVVYWQPVNGGSPMMFDLDEADKWIKEIVE